MITITINADTVEQARISMRQLLNEVATASVVADGGAEDKTHPEKPKTTRSTKAKKDDVKQDTEASSPPADTQDDTSSSSDNGQTATTTASPSEKRDLSEKAMRERITLYSAKAGPVALTEMQKNAGAPNGKFSEIMANPDFVAELDRQLTALGF